MIDTQVSLTQVRFATVVSINNDGKANIQFAGSSVVVNDVTALGSYQPAVGDVVAVLHSAGDLVILGLSNSSGGDVANKVQGVDAAGVTASPNPVVIGGESGGVVEVAKVDSQGNLYVAEAGQIVCPGSPVTSGSTTLTPPSNTLQLEVVAKSSNTTRKVTITGVTTGHQYYSKNLPAKQTATVPINMTADATYTMTVSPSSGTYTYWVSCRLDVGGAGTVSGNYRETANGPYTGATALNSSNGGLTVGQWSQSLKIIVATTGALPNLTVVGATSGANYQVYWDHGLTSGTTGLQTGRVSIDPDLDSTYYIVWASSPGSGANWWVVEIEGLEVVTVVPPSTLPAGTPASTYLDQVGGVDPYGNAQIAHMDYGANLYVNPQQSTYIGSYSGSTSPQTLSTTGSPPTIPTTTNALEVIAFSGNPATPAQILTIKGVTTGAIYLNKPMQPGELRVVPINVKAETGGIEFYTNNNSTSTYYFSARSDTGGVAIQHNTSLTQVPLLTSQSVSNSGTTVYPPQNALAMEIVSASSNTTGVITVVGGQSGATYLNKSLIAGRRISFGINTTADTSYTITPASTSTLTVTARLDLGAITIDSGALAQQYLVTTNGSGSPQLSIAFGAGTAPTVSSGSASINNYPQGLGYDSFASLMVILTGGNVGDTVFAGWGTSSLLLFMPQSKVVTVTNNPLSFTTPYLAGQTFTLWTSGSSFTGATIILLQEPITPAVVLSGQIDDWVLYTTPSAPSVYKSDHPPFDISTAAIANVTSTTQLVASPGAGMRNRVWDLVTEVNGPTSSGAGAGYLVGVYSVRCCVSYATTSNWSNSVPHAGAPAGTPCEENQPIQLEVSTANTSFHARCGYTQETV